MRRYRLLGVILGFLLCSLHTSAQIEETEVSPISKNKIGYKDPLYLQIYAGINKSANENLPWTEFSSYPWSGGAFISLGRELSTLWGWRTALRINHNKSRNVPECESKDVWGWNNTALFTDATFDITDVLSKSPVMPLDSTLKNQSPRFNLKAFVGVGAAYTWNFDNVPLSYTHPYSRSSKLLPAFRAGLTATWKLSNRWRLGAEVSQTLFEDHFNGVAHNAPLDIRTNLKVGLTYLLYKAHKAKKPVIRINKLKECPPLPLIMPDPEETKLRQIKGRAFLDFPVNETVIYPNYRNNPNELARIHSSIDSAMFDKTITITRISLHGYASPESPYSNNTRLAKGRTEALKSLLIRKYGFENSLFDTDYTPEDWENLRSFLVNTEGRRVKGDFWYDNKNFVETPEAPDMLLRHRDELLSVIDRSMDPDAKEEVLKRVGGGEPYRWLLQHVYPGLRHTDYIIEYKVKAYPVERGRTLVYIHPEAMSLEEMYKVAMSYEEGSENWYDALLIAVSMFPDDKTANLNAACACVMTKRLNDAKKYLKKAGDIPEARYVNNVVRAMEGSANWGIEHKRVVIYE